MHDLTQFKEELRRRLPLSRVVGARVRLKQQSGHSYKGLCPFHKEKTPSFHVFDDNANYHCFGCGAHGDTIDFIERTENLTFLEALAKMAQMVGVSMPDFKGKGEESRTRLDLWYKIYEEATLYFEGQLRGSEGHTARQYLENRLIAPSTWSDFRLGYAPRGKKLLDHLRAKGFEMDIILESKLVQSSQDGREGLYVPFQGRLIFPITDRLGKVIAFGGRLLGSGQPKYLNSPETFLFHKGRELYNHGRVRKAAKDLPLVVAEGYMDVIALHQMGECRPVATLGTACTPEQLGLLWRLSPTPILCFDGDSAGKQASYKVIATLLPLLKADNTASFLKLPSNMDPADLWEGGQKETFYRLLKAPTSLFDFIWQTYVLSTDVTTLEAQARIEKELLDMIGQIPDTTLRKRAYEWAKKELSTYFWGLKRSKTPALGKALAVSKKLLTPLPRAMPDNKASKIFMGFLIRYPQLVVDFEEETATFILSSPPLNALREEIIALCRSYKAIDNTRLALHLKEKGYESLLSQIGQATAADPFLSKSDQPYVKVSTLWLQMVKQQVWHLGQAEDRERCHKDLIEDFTPETWKKVSGVRQELQRQKQSMLQEDS